MEVYVADVIDGDTIQIERSIWISESVTTKVVERVRILGIDTYEKNGINKEKGLEARSFLYGLIGGCHVEIERKGHDKYGRVLAKVIWGGDDVADLLREAGFEKPESAKTSNVVEWFVIYTDKSSNNGKIITQVEELENDIFTVAEYVKSNYEPYYEILGIHRNVSPLNRW